MASKNILLVEGPDDKSTIDALINRLRIPLDCDIQPTKGINNLPGKLQVQIKLSETEDIERIGVIVDADDKLRARWQSIRDILTKSGYTRVPKAPAFNGTILMQPDKPRIGVWIMPDNQTGGALETFVSSMIPNDDDLWLRAGQAVSSLPKPLFKPAKSLKAQLHTWLAWQEEPGRPVQFAITAGYLRADLPKAQELMNWLRRLYEVS